MYAKIINNVIVEWPIQSLSEKFSNTSFPIPLKESDIPEGYVSVVELPVPEYTRYQKVLPKYPELVNGIWSTGWDIVPLSDEEQLDVTTNFNNNQKASRTIAYREESDPLFFKWQRGEATEAEWLAKIQEIKDRFPDLE